MKNPMHRYLQKTKREKVTAVSGALLVALLFTSTADAHFNWIVQASDPNGLSGYFGERPEPDAPNLLARAENAVLP